MSLQFENPSFVKCMNCGCHQRRSLASITNASAMRMIEEGQLQDLLDGVPAHIKERLSPHPLWAFGFDDFIAGRGDDDLVARFHCAVAVSPEVWKESTSLQDRHGLVRMWSVTVVLDKKDIYLFVGKEDGDRVLLEVLREGLQRLIAAVVEGCKDLEPTVV